MENSDAGTSTTERNYSVVLRTTFLVALFLLLIAVSFAAIWLPVAQALLSFHSSWTGFPDWLFTFLWMGVTLTLSTSLVAGGFLLVGLLIRRFGATRK